MTCPECEGEGYIEAAVDSYRPWLTREEACPTCDGMKVVPTLECDECGITIDAENMETAGKVGDDLLCLDCRMREVA
jgi:DnaJ-class molecular chaperone